MSAGQSEGYRSAGYAGDGKAVRTRAVRPSLCSGVVRKHLHSMATVWTYLCQQLPAASQG